MMGLRITNSLSRKKEEFIPLKDKIVNMYTCGVTAYDKCHIGHARSLYIFDVMRRYLAFRGYTVNFVRNITDVDDKIISKARELKVSSRRVAEDNIRLYEKDLKDLGIAAADKEPRATENIPAIIQAVQALVEKDMAYEREGDVYFRVRRFKDYGRLSGQSIENIMEAVRIEKDEKKEDPLDFALWKKSREDEPSWESPWGGGRPGWHIECSVMSLEHLKCKTLDIHAGGRDLIFPHHENEIAQAEALTGAPFARYWVHNGLLTINGQKMAKSLGNYITIQEALDRFHVDDLKIFFLSSHYASPIDFSEPKMEEAHKMMQRFDVLFWKASEIIQEKELIPETADFIQKAKAGFIEALDDDFNTPQALACLFCLVNDTNKFIDERKDTEQYAAVVYCAVDTLEALAGKIFGFFRKEPQRELKDEERALLEERAQARVRKDFSRSDELRALLRERDIIVEDTPRGQTWRWA